MALSLAKVLNNTATATKDYGEAGTLTIEYKPNALTEEVRAKLQIGEAMTEQNFFRYTAAYLEAVLASWDCLDPVDGSPLAISVKNMNKVPYNVILDIVGLINGDAVSSLGETSAT
jgi:hypothetical protein